MDDYERELVKRKIASILDGNSVYMSGPSQQSLKNADKIISYLEDSFRLSATKCGHGSWESYHRHGIACPTCDIAFRAPDGEEE